MSAKREEDIKAEKDVLAIYKMLYPKPKELLLSARRVIKHGSINSQVAGTKRRKPRYLFLFNDVLLICKKEGKTKFWLKTYIRLRIDSIKLQVCEAPPSVPDVNIKVEFRLVTPKKTIIFLADSPAVKKEWVTALQGCFNGDFDPNKSTTEVVVEELPPTFITTEKIVETVVERVIETKEEVFKFGGFDISEFDDDDEDGGKILESLDSLTLGGLSRNDNSSAPTVAVFESESDETDDDDDNDV